MKIAFIVHTTQRGGAAISNTMNLKYMLRGGLLSSNECLLVLPKGSDDGMYSSLISEVPSVRMSLPFSWIFVGAAAGLHRKLYRMVGEAFASISFLFRYGGFLEKENVTIYYLNSMVMWCLLPVLPQHHRSVIHIRETFDDSFESRVAIRIISRFAYTIVCINEQTALPFKDVGWKVKVIENPVDMYAARQLRNQRDELKEQMGIPKDTFVVSMFAPIGLQKGYDFLESVMHILNYNKRILFLSVGPIDKDAVILYNQLLQYPNFKHLPEQENVDKLYAITDVVIRCEDYFPFGRTVLEGIYAGCNVLLPFTVKDDIGEQKKYMLQMSLYPSRDATRCASVIDGMFHAYPMGVINNYFEPTGNVKEVSEKLLKSIMQV